MVRCLSSTVSSLLHNNKADEDIEVGTGVVVNETADKEDSEDFERRLDFHVEEHSNEIDNGASDR